MADTPTPEFTSASLTAIDAAIKSGATTVRYQDRTVVYRDADELLKLRALILNSIANSTGVHRIKQRRFYTGKGW